MEEIYEVLKGTMVVHDKYQGIVCGYTDGHFILAVETKDVKKFFRVLKNDFFVEEEYKDAKYRYILEDERTIEKQIKERTWQKAK
jgi:hypothetical protein